MNRITKTIIRETMNLHDFARGCGRKAKPDTEKHQAVISNTVSLNGLTEWLKDNRLSYTDQISFNKDGSSIHLITVYFGQLHYVNSLRK